MPLTRGQDSNCFSNKRLSVIDALATILAPGGRVRNSPYVQEAQFNVLFGEDLDPQNRHGSILGILKKHDEEVEKIAESYKSFAAGGRRFEPGIYGNEDFLRLYLAYYFTTNLSKVQLCLLDLVSKGKFASNTTIVDIGVGSGTTAVAVLDFLLAWGTACHLYGREFPVSSLRLKCYDLSPACLKVAEQVVKAYCNAVMRRKKSVYEQKAIGAIADFICSCGENAQWEQLDISRNPVENYGDSPVLLFASNILNELTIAGKGTLTESIAAMPQGSIATVIEPGDRDSCVGLNTWKISLLNTCPHIHSFAPCGGIQGDTTPCCSCWNSRRESLQEPPLYSLLRKRTGDPRSFDTYSNNLLSWSYSSLERTNELQPQPLNNGHIATRTIGLFRQKDTREWSPVPADLDGRNEPATKEYIKLCPLTAGIAGAQVLLAERAPGFIMPRVAHGSAITILNAQTQRHKRHPNCWIIPLGQGVEVKPSEKSNKNEPFLPAYDEAAREAIDEIAFRLFGFKLMYPFQHDILGRVLTGRSILGIAATGGGKSECFILPAMLFPGVTIVISPLKSLIQDQFDKRLDERYGLRDLATYINGDVPFVERQARLKRIELGYYKLVYFTPEQLRQSHVLNSLKRANDHIGIRYLALDEAHCISQWGHDFRDSYLNLVSRLSAVGIAPVRIALTATASPEVRADLCEELHLINAPLESEGDVYVHSSNRPELNLIVKQARSTKVKADDIITQLQPFRMNNQGNNHDAAIVFMPLTGSDPNTPQKYIPSNTVPAGMGRLSAKATNFASYLERQLETRVAIYHGKMDFDNHEETAGGEDEKGLGDLSGRSRRSEQNAFIEGRVPIMVATKGFGMGIDKPNIRLIIHRTPTSNLEAYAQESGRAGRDGEISDVVLYYSPDSSEDGTAEVRSDHKIQDFFLTQKYIRRDDINAMKDFLPTIKREICGHIYFTSDEIIPFFDDLQAEGKYEWPEFQPRLTKHNESDEHARILTRGHIYNNKIKYIDRILSALYRIRPAIGATRRECILESVQETGAVLKSRQGGIVVRNAEAIINSNAYFGQLLRDKGMTPDRFKELIGGCIARDTLELAEALGLPLSDTASMLLDVNRADGDFINGRWRSNLMDFLFIAAPRYGLAENKPLSALRDYVGAASRASRPDAVRRAQWAQNHGEARGTNRQGEISPSVDDWFGPWEITGPRGWEVRPGKAFKNKTSIEKYLEAFMDVHDRRESNDRAAYRLLLTDYVGVNEDGSLPGPTKKNNGCLRAILLGYLKTGEVVLGGNCHSCSRCCPDGAYERDNEKRAKAVERLGLELLDLLNSLEKSHSEIPKKGILKDLWKQVEVQEKMGRSLREYVLGWTGRLLTEMPGHKTALLIRLDGMLQEFLPLNPREACERGLELVEAVSAQELAKIKDTVRLFKTKMPDQPEALNVQATACQRLKQFEAARDLWQEILEKNVSVELQHRANIFLCKLFEPGAPLVDAELFEKHALQSARTAAEFEAAKNFYARIRPKWRWTDIFKEILFHHERDVHGGHSIRLVDWWVEYQSDIVRLSNAPTPRGWIQVIDETLSYLAEANASSPPVTGMIARTINKWSEGKLHKSPGLCSLRALRIALIVDGKFDDNADLVQECIDFLENAGIDHLDWIARPGRLDPAHYIAKVVRADLNFRRKDYVSADKYWRRYIDEPPADASDAVINHALNQLGKLHKSDGPLPDLQCLDNALSLRARRSKTWGEAAPFYSEILTGWNFGRLKVEINGITKKHDAVWCLKLMSLWMKSSNWTNDGNDMFSLLAEYPKPVLDANMETVSAIINHVPPMTLAAHPLFGPARIQAAEESVMAYRPQKNTRTYIYDVSAKPVPPPLPPVTDIEILTCATLIGTLDDKPDIALKLGMLVFGEKNDALASDLAAKYSSQCRDNIAGGCKNFFYNVYRPDSAKALERWLDWFGPLTAVGQEYTDHITKVADAVLKNALTQTHTEVGSCVSVILKHGIHRQIQNFAVMETCMDTIRAVEGKSDIMLVDKLEGRHLFELEHSFKIWHDDLHADILVSLLKSICTRTRHSWLTPLAVQAEALVSAGRLDEAEEKFGNTGLTVGRNRVSVSSLIKQWTGTKRAKPAYNSLLLQLTDLFVKSCIFH